MGLPSSGTISVDVEGVRSSDAKGALRWQLRWNEIIRICAYKTDAFVYDIICMEFGVEGATAHFCCDEEQKGWKELKAEIRRRYDLKVKAWWSTVAFPAFAENFTVIWERS